MTRSIPATAEVHGSSQLRLDLERDLQISFSAPNPTGRHGSADTAKREGVHYTPPELAQFLASQAINYFPDKSPLRVLDPSCGDGALLSAIADVAGDRKIFLCGMDPDVSAIEAAKERLASLKERGIRVELREASFLDEVLFHRHRPKRFGSTSEYEFSGDPFDLIIANPPYVRTQVLGAQMAKELAEHFDLSGRVDLYHAFVVAMVEILSLDGVMALLCSNRFMTTRSGKDMRKLLATKLRVHRIFDLGDTKQFKAAVLPAVVIASNSLREDESFDVTSIYETAEPNQVAEPVNNIFDALDSGSAEKIETGGRQFTIRRSTISPRSWDQPWVATTDIEGKLLDRVSAGATCRFKDIGKIRVGIKTTSDKVFIRRDWSNLPEHLQPEESLLLPLITHQVTERWRAGAAQSLVLYPYDLSSDKRLPLNLSDFPKAQRYLESHRAILEARTYVIAGGRHWWEIWVPQRPAAWSRPKLVFPDISNEPKFLLDETGSIVNGDCYWMEINHNDADSLGLLMLAVANSPLGSEFYDQSCGNKLYAGRRRYITQYVSEFPIPDPSSTESKEVVKVVKELLGEDSTGKRSELESELADLVWLAFGIKERCR